MSLLGDDDDERRGHLDISDSSGGSASSSSSSTLAEVCPMIADWKSCLVPTLLLVSGRNRKKLHLRGAAVGDVGSCSDCDATGRAGASSSDSEADGGFLITTDVVDDDKSTE